MRTHNDFENDRQIAESLDLLKRTFGAELLGVYLYGSAVAGGLQAFSDIDLFVVTQRPSSHGEKKVLLGEFLKISGVYQKTGKRPLEVLVVVKSELNPWVYPPRFDFQYGDWLRDHFESGKVEVWPSKEMPDLALLVCQLLLANKILHGPDPKKLLCQVPYKDVLNATQDSLSELMGGIENDTRNVLLTCARMWALVETDAIYSKADAALWALAKLEEMHKAPLILARGIYLGEMVEDWTNMREPARLCADYLKRKIERSLKSLLPQDFTNRAVRIHTKD